MRVSLLSSVLTVFGVWVDWPLSIVVAGRALDLQGRGMDTQVSDLVDRVVQGEVVELLILKSCPVIISNANKVNIYVAKISHSHSNSWTDLLLYYIIFWRVKIVWGQHYSGVNNFWGQQFFGVKFFGVISFGDKFFGVKFFWGQIVWG